MMDYKILSKIALFVIMATIFCAIGVSAQNPVPVHKAKVIKINPKKGNDPAKVRRSNSVIELTPYEKGFRDGYIDGYCSGDPNCVEPIPPVAPIPEPGFETKRDGYVKGVKKAGKDKKKD